MQWVEKPLAWIPLKKKDGYTLLNWPRPIASAPDEFRLTPYHTLQASTIKGTPVVESTWVPMATSTVEKTKGQVGSEKQDKIVMGRKSEQQIEDEQWKFIRDEVEKMKEAREELLKRSNRSSKRNKRKLENKKPSLRLKRNKGFKHSEEKTQNSILWAKRGLDELQDKLTSVSKMTQQEEGRQLAESVELTGPLDKRIEKILRVKDEALSLISYPSSESLQELESDEIDFEQYWYYAAKAEQIKMKMDKATRAFHEWDE